MSLANDLNKIDTDLKQVKTDTNTALSEKGSAGVSTLSELPLAIRNIQAGGGGSLTIDTAETLFDETTTEVVRDVIYQIPMDKIKYTNYLILLYIKDVSVFPLDFMNFYYFKSGYVRSDYNNVNHKPCKNGIFPIAFQVYANGKTGLCRSDYLTSYSNGYGNDAIPANFQKLRVLLRSKNFPIGTRIVIKGW